ncbi:RagB/SusD family nutrient uptake outer membrane protein [Puia sp. P3]|uniref:RagB/SusD family nutrient uptake outer membrane protein n=1 Tax=Puia sp. P3 TaxID=3423952 RepID=UPI003D6723FD
MVNTSTGFTESTKWNCLNQGGATFGPQIFLRMGEVYLNRAEANAKLGNMTKARADLKAVHVRAGLPGSDIDNLADNAVLAAVLKERRLELAFEGQNSFDYFRNGLPMTRTAADFNGTTLTVQPTDATVVFPTPIF